MMKNKQVIWMVAALLTTLFLAPSSYAQLLLDVKFPVEKALLNESIRAQVIVSNNSGRLLSFGSGEAQADFSFHIEDANGRIVKPFNDGNILDGINIISGETRAFDVLVSGFYSLSSPRAYRIKGVVAWNDVFYASRVMRLDIVRGFEVERLTIGVPGEDSATFRTYVLEYIQRDRNEELYLRIEDSGGDKVYGAFRLGRVIRSKKPIIRSDEAGNAHVLFETIGMNMVHVSYSPYGTLLSSAGIPVAGGSNSTLEQSTSGEVSVSVTMPER